MPRLHYRFTAEIEVHWALPVTATGVPSQEVPLVYPSQVGVLPASPHLSLTIKQPLVSDKILRALANE